MPDTLKKKTPQDSTEFEREQLRFFLTDSNAGAVLANINPSLAWLPFIAALNLKDPETQFTAWIEKNFGDPDAVREVAANIRFFGPETGAILEFRLNQTPGIPALLITCWRLIIRHMRAAERGALRGEWFDIAPRISRNDLSSELLERIAVALRPKVRVGKHLGLHDTPDPSAAERPTDLMSVEYEIEDGITDEDVLSVWSENARADLDDRLMNLLTTALNSAIEDAIQAGVEDNFGHSLSDFDVPSVAKHKQNAYRTGFLPIVLVLADLWTRLAKKDTQRALAFVEMWGRSPLRLTRRLALFAAADRAMPADIAAQLLIVLPVAELFLTSSTVEVYRLIGARWSEFTPDRRLAIESRIIIGPPTDWFDEDVERAVDLCRFDILGHLERNGVVLGAEAQATLADIRRRWPEWEVRPSEQAGFHFWHGEGGIIVGDPAKLADVPDAELVEAAKKVAGEGPFLSGDSWQALCQSDAPRALRGLIAQSVVGKWPAWAWRPFLWAAGQKELGAESSVSIAGLLLNWPNESFAEIASEASWWVNQKAKELDEVVLWPLWDRIAEAVLQKPAGDRDE